MTVNVHIDLGYEFSVKAPVAEVFAVLSDVPTSASHFLGQVVRYDVANVFNPAYSVACRIALDALKGVTRYAS